LSPPSPPVDVAALQRCLDAGGVAVVPTDTVYGLACDPRCSAAIRRMYAVKGRPRPRPAAVMFFTLEAAAAVIGLLGPRTCAAACATLPGPVTLLLPDPAHRWAVAGGGATVGLRVPELPERLRPLGALTRPLLQTSANPTGASPPARVDALDPTVGAEVDLVLDGGVLPGRPSSVVDLCDYEVSGRWTLIREGAVSSQQLAATLDSPPPAEGDPRRARAVAMRPLEALLPSRSLPGEEPLPR